MQDNNPLGTTNQKKAFTPNKGFTIMVGDTYIGYLNIGEKKVPAETVKALQNPKVMADILAKATLEPYSQEDRDMSGIADIIASATATTETLAETEADAVTAEVAALNKD